MGLAIDQPSAVRKFLERTPVQLSRSAWPAWREPSWSSSWATRSGGLPFTLVVEPDGKVAARKMGKLEPADLEAWRRGIVHG